MPQIFKSEIKTMSKKTYNGGILFAKTNTTVFYFHELLFLNNFHCETSPPFPELLKHIQRESNGSYKVAKG